MYVYFVNNNEMEFEAGKNKLCHTYIAIWTRELSTQILFPYRYNIYRQYLTCILTELSYFLCVLYFINSSYDAKKIVTLKTQRYDLLFNFVFSSSSYLYYTSF